MTPFSFAKVALRWAAAAELCLAFPSQLQFLPQEVGALFNNHDTISNSYIVPTVLAGGIVLVVTVVLWVFAGRLARYLVPAGADLTIPNDYQSWQQVGLTCVGMIMLFRVILALPRLILDYLYADQLSPIEALFYLVGGVLLIVGWRAPIRVLTRPFRRL